MDRTPAELQRYGDLYEQALAYLYARINYERVAAIPYRSGTFRLERMREILNSLGNPHQQYRIVHVAGTKGKGSTAAMLANVLQRAGYRTGLYTSPHLERIEERIVVDSAPCSSEELVELVHELMPIVACYDQQAAEKKGGPTFFEITTAMALRYFAQRRVDVALVEVGLGGRLDSTNVCQPDVSVITSISFDHQQQLGNTLASIAAEKAGIIKPAVPVISGVVAPEAAEVIRRVAQIQRAPLRELQRDFDFEATDVLPDRTAAPLDCGTTFTFRHLQPAPSFAWPHLRVALAGKHQLANAAVALETLHQLTQLGWKIPTAAIRSGLETVACPARIELLSLRPALIIDVAHNIASIAALLEELQRQFPQSRRVLVFAASQDKDVAGMLRLVLPGFSHIILTRYCNNPRAVKPEQLQQWVQAMMAEMPLTHNTRVQVADDPATAMQMALQDAAADDVVCVTGSFFLAAEVRPLLRTRMAAAEISLQRV